MTTYDRVITCSSWEERFLLGTSANVTNYNVKNIDIFSTKEFQHLSKSNLEQVVNIHANAKIHEISVNDELSTFIKIKDFINGLSDREKVLLDISTMPRFLIWYVLHFLSSRRVQTNFIYYQPESYASDNWLSRDPDVPKLIFKHSGVFLPDRQTVLLVQPGFDVERIKQLINRFEPAKLVLLSQSGNQFQNLERNKRAVQSSLSIEHVDNIEINAFDNDFGMLSIREICEQYVDSANVVTCSLGPKPASISMFLVNQELPEVGLIHAPAKEYNSNYSSGCNIDNPILGSALEG